VPDTTDYERAIESFVQTEWWADCAPRAKARYYFPGSAFASRVAGRGRVSLRTMAALGLITDADVVDLMRILARQMPDESIAAVLNRSGKATGVAIAGHALVYAPCAIAKKLRLTARANAASVVR
jgi:hypothetical protein